VEEGRQGTVVLLITADGSGAIVSIELKKSSGYSILDRSALDYVKRHWLLPAGSEVRMYQTSITYRLTPG
jgi:TonB family protein